MTQETARKELREAKANGFCPFCFVRGEPGARLEHERGCKAVNDAGLRRRSHDARRQRAERARGERYAQLLDLGVDSEQAIAQVYGISPERQRRRHTIDQLRAHGYRGPGFNALTRVAFHDEIRRRFLAAEEATSGHLLNPAGRRRNVDPRSLFTGSPTRALRYASEELMDWWAEHGRLTLPEYRAQFLWR